MPVTAATTRVNPAARRPAAASRPAAAPAPATAAPTVAYEHSSRKWYTFWKKDVHRHTEQAAKSVVLADTAENREKARQMAAKDGAQTVIVDKGDQLVVLTGGTMTARGGSALSAGNGGLTAGMKVTIDGVAASVLSTDSGFSEIDASNVVVAVIDTGVDIHHPALKGRVLPGYNALNGSSDVTDNGGHGTHVAGIIGAADGQMQGVAPNVKILPIKALGASANQNLVIAKAIRHAVDNGAHVINMSFFIRKGAGYDDVMAALDYAHSKNVVLCKSAGNTGKEGLTSPAEHPAVITVGALQQNHDRTRANYSSYGDRLDVAAPGDKVKSLKPGGGYVEMSGTSMASPHVAGLVALIRAQHPDWTVDQIKKHLTGTADDLGETGKDKYYGAGAVNAFRALFSA